MRLLRASGTTIKDLKIVDIRSRTKGGFIDLQSAEDVVLENVECTGCLNAQGPSCISGTSSSVTMNSIHARGNSGAEGGALGFIESAVAMNNSLFENNEASQDGGAVHLQNCDLKMASTSFQSNRAGENGGGLATRVTHLVLTGAYAQCIFLDRSLVLP